MSESKFKKLLVIRKNDYKTWVPVYSPALKEYVYFNAQGFNHLRFKVDNTPRNPKEAMYKLGLLPLVRSVIHQAHKVEKYQQRLSPVGGTRTKILKQIEYWGLIGIVGKENVKIRVVVRRVANSTKIYFWSVMKKS